MFTHLITRDAQVSMLERRYAENRKHVKYTWKTRDVHVLFGRKNLSELSNIQIIRVVHVLYDESGIRLLLLTVRM